MDWNTGIDSGMDYGLSFMPGFYFIVRLFMCALPEDGNATSLSQYLVALLHGQGRDR